jgi:hypothetical protein
VAIGLLFYFSAAMVLAVVYFLRGVIAPYCVINVKPEK